MVEVLEQAGRRLCATTGLQIVRAPATNVFRIASSRRGAMDPPVRSGTNSRKWGRWDTAGGRTIYVAETVQAAFSEVVPYIRENLPIVRLSTVFDLEPGEQDITLADAVRTEMPNSPMHDSVSRGWREDRNIYELRPPCVGWFLDISAADSIAALNSVDTQPYWPRLTVSHLTGEDRSLTTSIASWARGLTLDDGSVPIGIRYLSKHGSDQDAYAIWLRAVDDGKPLSHEPTREHSRRGVRVDDPDLLLVAKRNKMKVF